MEIDTKMSMIVDNSKHFVLKWFCKGGRDNEEKYQ